MCMQSLFANFSSFFVVKIVVFVCFDFDVRKCLLCAFKLVLIGFSAMKLI